MLGRILFIGGVVALSSAAGCSCPDTRGATSPAAPSPASTAPPPSSTTEPTGTAVGVDLSALGRSCADDALCPSGTECVSYYGVAGPAIPPFQTCEIRCSAKAPACPASTRCVTIADGPGSVCRRD